MLLPDYLCVDEETQVKLTKIVVELARLHSRQFLKRNQNIGVIPFQKSQHRWFQNHYRDKIFTPLFHGKIPKDFLPHANNRRQQFYGAITPMIRREFMIQGLEELWKFKDSTLKF